MGQKASTWQAIPDDVLAEVASYLKLVDTRNASLACKHWHRIITSLSVLYQRSFYFNGTELDRRAVDFAARHGDLKVLRLDFVVSRNVKEIEALNDNIFVFLSKLLKNHTSLDCLSVHSNNGGSIDCTFIGEALAEFMKTQTDLEVFELTTSSFHIPVNVLLLILSALNRLRLRKLTLQKFTTLPRMLYRDHMFLGWMDKCTNIQSLSLQHDFISDEVLVRISKGSRYKWKKLVISYENLHSPHHFLSNGAWRDAVVFSPYLTVTYILNANITDLWFLMDYLLEDEMPLTDLIINLDVNVPMKEFNPSNISALPSKLGRFLNKFYNVLDNTQVNLISDLPVNFLPVNNMSANPEMVSLDVALSCENEELEEFCKTIIDSPTKLESLNLFISPVTDNMIEKTTPLMKSFFQKIKAKGIECQLYPMGVFDQHCWEKYRQQIYS